ncbi:MAG: O-antigen ligase family protein [Dehalococcoidia bacterium]|nr:O-antigen ligase family protein [Dehalococcoidia bacterium]
MPLDRRAMEPVPTRALGIVLIAIGLGIAVAAAPAAFAPWLYDDFTLIKQSVLLVAAAPTLVGLALTGEVLPRQRGLRIAVMAWVVMLVLSMATALDARGSVLGVYQYRQGFLTQAAMVVLFLGALRLAAEGLPRWFMAAAGTGVALCVAYTLVQAVGADPFDWWIDTSDRAIGTIGNANELAAYAVVWLGFAGLRVRGERRALAVMAALAAGAAFVVLESESRSGLLALAMIVVLMPVAWWLAKAPWARFGPRVAALAGGIALGAAASFATGGLDGSATRIQAGVARQETSGSTRIELWKGTVATIGASPLTGFGPDGLALAFPRHRPELDAAFDDYDLVAQSSHNWALDTMANLGIPGFVALTAVMVFAAWGSVREGRRGASVDAPITWCALAGYGALTMVNPVSLAAQACFFVLLGIAAAERERELPRPVSRIRLRAPVAAMTTAPAALALLSIAALQVAADARADDAWTATAEGDFATAAAKYEEATNLVPFSRRYASEHAYALLARGSTGDTEALRAANDAYARFDDLFGMESGDAIARATALIGLGRPESQVRPFIERARRLNPHGVYIDAYTAILEEAARNGGTLRYVEKDRWVAVTPKPSGGN